MSVRVGGRIIAGGVIEDSLAKSDFSNITDVARNISNWSNNVSDCIIQISEKAKVDWTHEVESESLYSWVGDELLDLIYTKKDNPSVGDLVYKGKEVEIGTIWSVEDGRIQISSEEPLLDLNTCYLRNSETDLVFENPLWSVTILKGSEFFVYTEKRTLENDVSSQIDSSDGTHLLFCSVDGLKVGSKLATHCFVGTSDEGSENTAFYNTETNTITHHELDGTSWSSSLPIGYCVFKNQKLVSFKIFDDFGEFSTILFALPTIKYLIPNKTKEDGSLITIEKSVDVVSILDVSGRTTEEDFIYLDSFGKLGVWEKSSTYRNFFPTPSVGKHWLVYDEEKNVFKESNNGRDYFEKLICLVGTLNYNVEFGLTTKKVFHLVDQNNFDNLFDKRVVPVSTTPAVAQPNTYYFITE